MGGKRAGRFDERLVRASAEMIRDRWRPDPAPTWLTFVPSLSHPGLVPDFARKLSNELGIPAIDAVSMVRQNRPQKEMENTHHRCLNLDGVFEISGRVQEGPVLLVDDAVDSGWTFAVIAALLRRAGSGPVFPFAVVSTTSSS
jgi:ATP-dependent DNA helicase RecQ